MQLVEPKLETFRLYELRRLVKFSSFVGHKINLTNYKKYKNNKYLAFIAVDSSVILHKIYKKNSRLGKAIGEAWPYIAQTNQFNNIDLGRKSQILGQEIFSLKIYL